MNPSAPPAPPAPSVLDNVLPKKPKRNYVRKAVKPPKHPAHHMFPTPQPTDVPASTVSLVDLPPVKGLTPEEHLRIRTLWSLACPADAVLAIFEMGLLRSGKTLTETSYGALDLRCLGKENIQAMLMCAFNQGKHYESEPCPKEHRVDGATLAQDETGQTVFKTEATVAPAAPCAQTAKAHNYSYWTPSYHYCYNCKRYHAAYRTPIYCPTRQKWL